MKLSPTTAALLVLLSASTVGAISGCSSGSGKPESIASEERVGQIVEMRKYFDKAGGNWDALSAEDKAAYTKLAGDDKKAQTMWRTMSTPMGANPSGG
jgi:hypothetical protein